MPPYGIRTKTIWINRRSAKGYLKADFGDVFARYVPRNEAMEFAMELVKKELIAKAERAAIEKKKAERGGEVTNPGIASNAPPPGSDR